LLQHLFTEKSGIFINFKQYGYGELKSLCLSQERILKEEIDIVMFDISWLNQLEEVNLLHDLDDVISQEYLSSYVEGIDQHYRGNSGKLLGLPLLTGTQLLFYQKDLFQDSSLKIMYQRMFGEELKVPNNWTDYNKIAKFFTKQFNEKSPVKYGTAMIKSGNLYNTIEYLNRLWAFGGDIQNGSQTTLTNEVARYALQNYHEIAQFTPDYCESWEDMATYFKKGEIAMVILYDSFAYGLNSAMESHVSGNIGSNIIPGKSPVLGGWGLGITKQSVNFEAAIEFEKWACSQEIDKPFSVLTGVSSHRDFYLNSELSSMYPWKDKLLPSFKLSRVRPILKNNKLKLNSITFYEQLGSQLNQFLNDEISGKELLKKWKEY
jgi:ABC-type glycerol-3-phosphate transport system substrate-binding protein